MQALEITKKDLSDKVEGADRNVQSAEKTLIRYIEFDAEACKRKVDLLEIEVTSALTEARTLENRKNKVEDALKPVSSEIRRLTTEKKRREKIRERAREIAQKLSNADNSYERAILHEECEKEFKKANPRSIIAQSERELVIIDRDLTKLLKRAKEIVQRASCAIATLIVDGNNLCYASGQFVGLSALDVAIPLLKSEYSVTIIFDSEIRRMLRTDEKTISHRFGDRVNVHIVANGRKADETIVDLASSDEKTFILSNDTFGEFTDKPAIKKRRVVQHAIVGGRILIHGLGIDATFTTK